jgi:hypothetical protein
MGRSRILLANCYDYPQYYDIAFQAYTRREADFIEPPAASIARSPPAGSWSRPAAVDD